MSEGKQKLGLMWLIRIGIILGIAAAIFFGLRSCSVLNIEAPELPSISDIFDIDPVMGYKSDEIVDIILGENRETKELKVMEQDITGSVEITDTFLNIDWFKKTQTVNMTGTASYVVDLSDMDKDDIIFDEEEKTITIVIPHAELDLMAIDFNETTFSEVDHSVLSWGDIKLSPEQQNEIEKDLQAALTETASQQDLLDRADRNAIRQVESLYKGLLVNLKPDVKLKVVFDVETEPVE